MPNYRQRELELLERLRRELENTTVDASPFALLYTKVGLQIAVSLVEEIRIEILCEEIIKQESGK